MKLSEVKNKLNGLDAVNFVLENGQAVPQHFHVTEVGMINKHFIDCGGTIRDEKLVSFQLWNANDLDHRLEPAKLLKIIGLSENALGITDGEVEVEYQSDTVGKYGLDFNGKEFVLTTKKTACLASDQCGVPAEKQKLSLTEIGASKQQACCTPGGGCC